MGDSASLLLELPAPLEGILVRDREAGWIQTQARRLVDGDLPLTALVGDGAVEQRAQAVVVAEERGFRLAGNREALEDVRQRSLEDRVEQRAEADQKRLRREVVAVAERAR